MKQVWQTEDGAIFETKEEAEQYCKDVTNREDLASMIYNNAYCVTGYDDAKEIAALVLAHYNMSRK